MHNELPRGRDEVQGTYDVFVPKGTPPKIVCAVCSRGPLDGFGLHRRGEGLFCQEHMPERAAIAENETEKLKRLIGDVVTDLDRALVTLYEALGL
jgi:hypothetical protein